jgi:Arc/MetJ-type ribon-helix-helix transcriptional regulator
MATLTIEITDTMKEYVDRKTVTGGFKDSSAFVQALIDIAILAETRAHVDQALLEAVDQVERGECIPWEPGESRRLLHEMIRQRRTNGTT